MRAEAARRLRASQEAQEALKRCARCKKVKPSSEFGRDASRKDGLRNNCRACRAAHKSV